MPSRLGAIQDSVQIQVSLRRQFKPLLEHGLSRGSRAADPPRSDAKRCDRDSRLDLCDLDEVTEGEGSAVRSQDLEPVTTSLASS